MRLASWRLFARSLPRQHANMPTRAIMPTVVALAAMVLAWPLSAALSGYYVYLGISVVTASIAVLGLGVVTGSAGIIALCQLTFAAIGAWVVAWMNVHHVAGGFLVWLLAGGVTAALAGVLIGLPALRLRGVNLAVVTLGLAAACDATLVQTQFPGQVDGIMVDRPAGFASDRSYFFFSVLVLIVCALAVALVQRSRIGSSWRSVAFSERGTAAAGQRVWAAKLSAFAVSATLGGISGGLLVAQVGLPLPASFTPIQSLALYILAVMSGAYLIDMAIFAGLMWVLVPELLRRLGVAQDWGLVVFGLLGVQALTAGSNLGEAIRFWARRALNRDRALSHELSGEPAAAAPEMFLAPAAQTSVDSDAATALEIHDLSVKFGELQALDRVWLRVRPRSIMGLIGPNGAGKSTLVDAVSGFLPQHAGRVLLEGRDVTGLTPAARARAGLRRTFQQDRVPLGLTIEAYVRYVARRRIDHNQLRAVLTFLGCPPPSARLAGVDVGARRLVEVAAAVLAEPRVLILDEPAAGLSYEDHRSFGQRLSRIPERFDTAIVLIEHDLDLVRAVCTEITVLDFGRVIAQGSQEQVLADPSVIAAYMGEIRD